MKQILILILVSYVRLMRNRYGHVFVVEILRDIAQDLYAEEDRRLPKGGEP